MYNRIAIIGGPGTGKTTLANQLSKILGIPATHIDGIHHLDNWQKRDSTERDNIILDITSKDKWIIDGTYKATLKQRLEKADLVIWLDYSTYVQIKGILKRYFMNHGKEKAEIPGCKEKMDKEFFHFTLTYRRKQRHYITDAIATIDSSKVLRFTKRKYLNIWLRKVVFL